MKQAVIVAILCITVGVQGRTVEETDILIQQAERCAAETNIGNGTIIQLDPNLARYAFCIFKATGILNENGDPQRETIKKTLQDECPLEEIDDFLAKCTPKASTPFEKAKEYWNCSQLNCKGRFSMS